MTLADPDVIALEAISARAWPAARSTSLGGWRLYATSGFSGRINACWPLDDPGLELAQAVIRAEAWFESCGLPSLFKIVEGAAPALTAELVRRGYHSRTETVMMTGPARGSPDPSLVLSDVVDPAFAAVFTASSDDPGDARERLETLARVPAPRAFALLEADAAPAAIGACAVEGDWAGVFAMRTAPRYRRRGLARRVFASLLAYAAELGARGVWLQVEADNTAALALYQAAGFAEAYRYRYWFRPAPPHGVL